MLFTSAEYAVFLPVVLGLYLLFGRISLRAQNGLLLVASYFFYGWWDWRFLGLLFFSSAVDFVVGYGLEAVKDERKRWPLLLVSLCVNLGVLAFFKYYNFFVSSLVDSFATLGVELHAPTLNVILPVGLSFYTFQALTYTIDIYRRQMKPTRDPILFLAYVSFFPQLVAGPIERAKHLLPQFTKPRHITPDGFANGLRQITWGLFCKLVVADNCAGVVNAIFSTAGPVSGSLALLGGFFFAFQIYGDFSGYSHIALGTARLLGFELMQNFATPYFSQSIPEFWRRWHISLSSWFRDYVFIPLGGSRVSKPRQIYNILFTFTLSGLWHGANWTFIAWGFLNGLYYLPKILFGEPLERFASARVAVVRYGTMVLRMGITFGLVVIAWIFFRANTIGQAFDFIGSIFSPTLLVNPLPFLQASGTVRGAVYAVMAIGAMVTLEWWQRDKQYALEVDTKPATLRWATYACVIGLIVWLRYTGVALDFIYFQF